MGRRDQLQLTIIGMRLYAIERKRWSGLPAKLGGQPRSSLSCRSLALMVAAASALLTNACSGSDVATVHRESDVSVVVSESDTGGDAAGLGVAGDVSLVGTCLGIGFQSVVWPPGTEVASANPVTVVVPGLGELTIGDAVVAEGYTVDGESDFAQVFPEGCPIEDIVVLTP